MQFVRETKKTLKKEQTTIIQEAKSFFEKNQPLEDETFIAVKVSLDKDNKLNVNGLYFGKKLSFIDIKAQTDRDIKEVHLAKVIDKESMLYFIEKNNNENIYLFKLHFIKSDMQEMVSFYSREYKIDLTIYQVDGKSEKLLESFTTPCVKLVFPLEI